MSCCGQPRPHILAAPRLEAAPAHRSPRRTAHRTGWPARRLARVARPCVLGSGHRKGSCRCPWSTSSRVLSRHQQAGGAATRLIMSSLAGPGGLSEQEAAAVRRLCNAACIPAFAPPLPGSHGACSVRRHARWSRRRARSCAKRSRRRSAAGARESAPPRSGGWSSRLCGTARTEWSWDAAALRLCARCSLAVSRAWPLTSIEPSG